MQVRSALLSQYDEVWHLRSGCPSEQIIAAYIDHTLSLEQTAELELHLASCYACRILVRDVARSIQPTGSDDPQQ
jgi:hypothetical protein